MKICFLSRQLFSKRGGIETFTLNWANALSERGHEVHIITVSGKEVFNNQGLHKNIMIHRVNYKDFSFRGLWRLENIIPLKGVHYHWTISKAIKKLTKTHKIDILEIPDTEYYYPVFLKKIPFVIHLHGHHGNYDGIYQDKQNGMFWQIRHYILKKWASACFNRAGVMLAVSNAFADEVAGRFNLKRHLIKTIYHGINQSLFKPAQTKENTSLQILFVGRLQKSKGVEVLAQAIPLVAQKYQQAKFVFVGRNTVKEDTGESYKAYLKDHLGQYNIEIRDEIEQKSLVAYYQNSTICVFPSLYEPGGTVCLESLSSGCATIASNIGGFAEFIQNRINGILIPPGDYVKLAEAIIELINNEALRTAIADNGYKKAIREFNLDLNVTRALQLYQEVIAQHNGANKKICF